MIDDQNNQLGVVSLDAALRIASEKGLDLVEVAPQASPPVARLMDYGRFKFETIKREKDQRRKQNVGKLMRASAWKSHLLEHKSKKRKRNYAKKQGVAQADRKEVRRALGI